MTFGPVSALRQRAEDYAPGDTDLTSTVSTPWRAALASAFDTVQDECESVTAAANPVDPSAELLAGWLSSRLCVEVPAEKAEVKHFLGHRSSPTATAST